MATDAAVAGRMRPERPLLLPGLAVVAAAAALAVGGDIAGLRLEDGGTAVLEDPTGPLVAAVVILVWLAAGTPYAVVAGQVGLVVGLDGGPAATPIAQAALVGVLVVDVAASHRGPERVRTAVVGAATAVVLVGIVRYVTGTVAAAVLVVAVAALSTYTIHRFERLTLGLVGDAE
jgi:hypothetical protein